VGGFTSSKSTRSRTDGAVSGDRGKNRFEKRGCHLINSRVYLKKDEREGDRSLETENARGASNAFVGGETEGETKNARVG